MSVSFMAAWGNTQATPEKINKWNATSAFSRAYLDVENDPVIELDLDLEAGSRWRGSRVSSRTIRTASSVQGPGGETEFARHAAPAAGA